LSITDCNTNATQHIPRFEKTYGTLMNNIIIKNKRDEKMIYCGIIDAIIDPLSPISKIDYSTNKELGDETYDDYKLTFVSSEITITIDSIKNTSHKIINYPFYKSKEADEKYPHMSNIDKEYYKIISNIIFVEYVVSANVEINYKNKIEKFTDRQTVDAYYRYDKNIPRTITY